MANKDDQDSQKEAPVVVIMVPFPAHSHLQQLLQLSCLISSYNIPVHYVGSTVHNHQVKVRMCGFNSIITNTIQFHDFPIPHFPSPLPNPNASNKFPAHLQPSFEAYLELRQPVAALLQTLSITAKRLIVIHDSIVGSVVQDAASIPNAETYAFQSVSAFASFFTLWEAMGKPFRTDVEVANKLPSIEGCFNFEIMNLIAYQADFLKFRVGDLHNTCRSIEGTYLDLLERINENRRQWALGPLNLVTICKQRNSNSESKCLEWLDKQKPNCVIYVSFGTSTSLADEQIKELALGLEESRINFIWVLREADTADASIKARRVELPNGFEERTKEIGIVVREWVPQMEILAHPSTGGFMSHCGWNSCMESISMGVPMAAWPMHSDQPMNAVLVTELLKIGVMVREWACRQEIVTSSTIKETVRKLMASDEGETMRDRARELGETVQKQAAVEGGARQVELDSFIAHISR